jgi:ubiquinone/menaquinone biosynthesis C-methylase UbiE
MISLEFDSSRKQTGALRVSRKAGPSVAVVADLGDGLPFKNDSVEEVYLDHALESVPDFLAAMREIWRICRPGALVHVWLPHASSTG